jgi:hypothetical protein
LGPQAGVWWAIKMIPAVMSMSDTTSPTIAPGLARNRTPSQAMPTAMETIGSDADDRLDRCQEPALLEGVLSEDEAGRADDGEGVDRPAGEHLNRPAAEFGRH